MQRLPRRVGADLEHRRILDDVDDRLEVAVGERGLHLVRQDRDRRDRRHQRVAVGLRLCRIGEADRAAAAGLVHHDHRLSEVLLGAGGERPEHEVRRPARGVGDDDLHFLGGELLGEARAR